MPEKFEGKFESGKSLPGSIEKVEAPKVSEHLSFIKEAAGQYGKLDIDRTEQLFQEAFKKLPDDEQKAISLELQGLGVQIGALDKQNEGIALVRESEIVLRVLEILDRSGVVASAKKGGMTRAKELIAEPARKAAAYLGEYEAFVQSVKNKPEDMKQEAKYLLAVTSGIRQELERLQLTDVASVQSLGELQKERSANGPMVTSILTLGTRLDSLIYLEGLIGFSTFNKLIKEFHSSKEIFEDQFYR